VPTSKDSCIVIRGARVHNLKGVDVDIPKNKLVVITGLSGSGKSSLAFDTIYAEAERRFVESLSSYARQFLGIKEKPDVESISGLSPAIAIDQKSVSKNPRSTVGTITEIYDYLRILFSRAGVPHCPECKKPIGKQNVDSIVKQILKLKIGTKISVLAPVVRSKKGEHKGVLAEIARAGFLRVRIDTTVMRTEEAGDFTIDPKKSHTIEVVVDRLIIDPSIDRPRLRESLETALKVGKGLVLVITGEDENELLFSEHFACPDCGVSIPDLEPRLFSFNSPYGACAHCTGLGSTLEVDSKLVLPNMSLSLAEGAIRPWAAASHRVGRQSWYWWMISDLAERYKFSTSVPIKQLPKKIIDIILYGEQGFSEEDKSKFEGVIPNLKRRWKETDSEWTRQELEKYMTVEVCPQCKGMRLRPEALGVLFREKNIADIAGFSVAEAHEFFTLLLQKEGKTTLKSMATLLREIDRRVSFLMQVGLEYLTIDRSSTTLAGGEAQRVRLATQIGSSLTGVLYVLDEPSIGLHMRDHARLLKTLKDLRDMGNTVLVVEHDMETMMVSDWIIDIGPGAGVHGGQVIFAGTPKQVLKAKTPTGDYLSGKKTVHVAVHPDQKKPAKQHITIRGAVEHNLKNVDVTIPLGKLVVVSGVSGSGKSSLIDDILARAMLKHFYDAKEEPGKHKEIEGFEYLDKGVVVDQAPIGRTPRSNPATYTGVFSLVRDIFSSTVEARARGYKAGRFSFNVKGGRCEVCEGQGTKKIEMYFLPDLYVECEECKGRRYNREALEILYQGKNIADVLDFSIEEAYVFFKDIPQIEQRLKTLVDVGLGYMKLGQSATTLSGGEAQRVKLAFELSKKATGKTLYVLDEPTTGLHFEDIQKLLIILRALVDKGNSVVIIEHNMEMLKNADWIIDMGPEGGAGGGMVVAEGSPADVAKSKKSYTGQWLKKS
jgi:excinuclease ABC subunit A